MNVNYRIENKVDHYDRGSMFMTSTDVLIDRHKGHYNNLYLDVAEIKSHDKKDIVHGIKMRIFDDGMPDPFKVIALCTLTHGKEDVISYHIRRISSSEKHRHRIRNKDPVLMEPGKLYVLYLRCWK